MKRVDDANFVRSQSNQINEMNRISDKLKDLREIIRKLKESERTLKVHKIYCDIQKDVVKISNMILEAKNSENTGDQLQILSNLLYEIDKLKVVITNTWKMYLDDISKNIMQNAIIIDSLRGTSYAAHVKQIVTNMKENYPITEVEVLILEKKQKELADMTEALNLNDTVKSFISKLSANKATLDDLDGEIITWLKEFGFSKKVSLRMM